MTERESLARVGESVSTSTSVDRQFEIFSALWAIATLFHMAHSGIFDSRLNYALLTLAALYVVFRPSLAGFILLISLQLFDAVYRMPLTTNHWIFTAFVNLTILQTIVYLVVRNRSFDLSGGDLLKTFAPVVRAEVIILYFFTFFHKLNAGFFSPATSCATDLLKAQHIDTIIPMNDTLIAFNAHFTIVIEFLIPLFLCFRRTRHAGILAGLFFHAVLSYSSYNAFYDFSSMMFALYFLFAGDGFSQSIVQTFGSLRSMARRVLKPRHYSMGKLVFTACSFLVALAVVYWLTTRLAGFKSFHLYFFWTIYSSLFVYCFVMFMLSGSRTTRQIPAFMLPHRSFLILPCIVFLNGASPYLGLKTENSFAMFSNLRTEGGVSNHYVVPAGLQIFSYQKDVVEIISSSDPYLQQLADQQKLLVLFEFCNYVHNRNPTEVVYLLNGERKIFRRGMAATALPKNSYLLAKLMKFRAFSKHEPQPCSH
ncbi:hypothetical protein KK083_02450 [Fulvivirgaceae bacterium PWU4]|uniref:HTTM domain-containing protein n=1 Tax=Chryseosolibacter histidini TaxID=2782349 RepID=A0AAP2DG43_9BACT|nr:hypothetical protein [Chryseosolibacter histidini]MBT1695720.1 hypothetical protein [Chryseosolibacter histidini]